MTTTSTGGSKRRDMGERRRVEARPRGLPSRPCAASDAGRARCPKRSLRAGRSALQLDVVLQAHAGDHLELLLEEIDVLLLTFEDAFEHLAAGEVAHAL